MSDNEVLSRFTERFSEERPSLEQRLEGEPWEDIGAFSVLRGIRDRALMLELRKKTGSVLAVGYGWLEKAEFDPSEGITLHMVGQAIRIRGRNLNAEVRPQIRLFDALVRHRVPFIREAGNGERIRTAETACIVESIDW